MARVKFGMEPRGLNFIYGSRFEDALRHDVIMPMLIGRQENFREYLKWIRALPPDPQPNQLRFEDLIADLKNNHLDGNSVVQITSNIKHHFQEQAREKKYQWLRAGIVQDNDVVPQLLLRRDQKLTRVDLEHLEIFDLPVAEYFNSLANGKMVIADETEDDIKKNTRFKFSWGLETAKAPIVEK